MNYHPIQRSKAARKRRRNGKGSKWITKLRRLAIYLRDGFTCVYCQRDLHCVQPSEITLDHIICKEYTKREDGTYAPGTHDSSNLVTACVSCNSKRGCVPLPIFARILGDSSILTRVRNAKRRRVPIELAKSLMEEK